MLMTVNNENSTYEDFQKYVSIRKEQSLKNVNIEKYIDYVVNQNNEDEYVYDLIA